VAVLCEFFSRLHILSTAVGAYLFFLRVCLFLLSLLFRGGRTPMDMLSKTQKVKNVDMKLLPLHTILSTSRADSSSEIATLLYHPSYRFLDPLRAI